MEQTGQSGGQSGIVGGTNSLFPNQPYLPAFAESRPDFCNLLWTSEINFCFDRDRPVIGSIAGCRVIAFCSPLLQLRCSSELILNKSPAEATGNPAHRRGNSG